MPRALSSNTKRIYWWAWRWPWASAKDIARVTGIKENTVSNALRRGEKKLEWFVSARLGRTSKAVDRYVFTKKGIEEMGGQFGLEPFWWHAADSVRALARRLEVLEMAYRHLPDLWQSNAVSKPHVWMIADMPRLTDSGETTSRPELLELNWSEARLHGFHWLKTGPFEAIATYSNGYSDADLLYLPILWRGFFQKPNDIAQVRRDMHEVLVEDERWESLPRNQGVLGDYFPGMVIFCPDRVSAAMVQRNWLESATLRQNRATPAILDAQGQVIRAMDPPLSLWRAPRMPPRGGDPGNICRTVSSLGDGAYAAINGLRAFRTFRAVDGSPGVTMEQIAAFRRVDATVADRLLAPMVKSRVLACKAGGHYLDQSGRGLLADSQRRSRGRVKRGVGVYTRSREYRSSQRLHNQGQAQAILELRKHGFQAFPALGVVIDRWYQGRLIRVVPDAFVLLPPGVLVAVEFERSATTPGQVEKKAINYQRLAASGKPIPVLFITETTEAARNLASLRFPFLLATTLEMVQTGPHGRAVIRDGTLNGPTGCWWFWFPNDDAPAPEAPIDLWAQDYVLDDENMAWRVPIDNPWRLLRRPPGD